VDGESKEKVSPYHQVTMEKKQRGPHHHWRREVGIKRDLRTGVNNEENQLGAETRTGNMYSLTPSRQTRREGKGHSITSWRGGKINAEKTFLEGRGTPV